MRCLVVYCHPLPESFGAALRDAALSALSERGWEVRLTDLYAEGFDPVLSPDERRNMEHAPTDPKLGPHIDNLKWAQAILFVYPTLVVRPAGDAEGLAGPASGGPTSPSSCQPDGRIVSLVHISAASASSPPAARRGGFRC